MEREEGHQLVFVSRRFHYGRNRKTGDFSICPKPLEMVGVDAAIEEKSEDDIMWEDEECLV